jgi:hypothetical protein
MAARLSTGGVVLSSSSTAFSYASTSPVTFMTWIYANDSTVWTNRTSMVGVYGPSTPTTAIQIGSIANGSVGAWTWGGATLVSTTGHSPVGQWNHYTVVYDAGTFYFYINAVLVSSQASTQLTGNFTQTSINGFPTGGTSESGNFCTDDTILFNRALSLNEIKTIYSLEGPRDGITQNVLARYTFDEGAVGSNILTGWDISVTRAHMTPSVGTQATYFSPRAMCNVRRVQG